MLGLIPTHAFQTGFFHVPDPFIPHSFGQPLKQKPAYVPAVSVLN